VAYQVKLDSFEGPLDLLLHLINKEEMDIYNISIAKITDQYLQYVHRMQALQLDVASEFLVMAATLLAIKSKMLLPVHEPDLLNELEFDEDDPREELIQRLLEYKKYKELSGNLKDLEIARSKVFTRPPSNLAPYLVQEEGNPVRGISLYHLVDAFEKALIKLSYRDPLTRVEREEISVKSRIEQILLVLKQGKGLIYFTELFVGRPYREEVVVTFLSILELMKQKLIFCVQTEAFDDIVIHYTPNMEADVGGEVYGLQ